MNGESGLPNLSDVKDLNDRTILLLLYQHALTQRCPQHERRLRRLENWRIAIVAGYTATVAAFGYLKFGRHP